MYLRAHQVHERRDRILIPHSPTAVFYEGGRAGTISRVKD